MSYYHSLAELSLNIIARFFYIIQIADFLGKALTFRTESDIMYNVYLYAKIYLKGAAASFMAVILTK